MANINYRKLFLWCIVFFVIYAMALQRPVHQDDGWYASYALRYLDQLGFLENASYFSYADMNGGHDSPVGVSFAAIQTLFYYLFDFSIPTARLFNSIIVFGIVAVFYLIVNRELPKFKWWLVLLLITHPVFYYHYYNRPEILAALLVLTSIYLLLYKGERNYNIFIAYFIWAFVLDTHPIAIFLLLGIGSWFWVKNHKKTWFVLAGGLSGLMRKITLNQLINGNIGLFAGFIGQVPLNFGDHYVPLMKSDFADYLRIFKDRLNTVKSFIALSGIWLMVPIVIFGKQRRNFLGHPLTLNCLSFLFFTTIGTEASSNGFGLYSILNVFLVYVIVLKNIKILSTYKFSWLVFIPILLYSVKSTGQTFVKYFNYNQAVGQSYIDFTSCIKPNSYYLMRPTFVFGNQNKNIEADYTFGLTNVMIQHQLSFMDAVLYKGYDYILFDKTNLGSEFIFEHRSPENFANPAYKRYLNIGISKSDFNDLVSSGKLQAVCEFNEISHGHTVLYKVNKSP